MITHRICFLNILIMMLSFELMAQSDSEMKVDRIEHRCLTFCYNGKPISPIALVNIFPKIACDEDKEQTVDLKQFPLPQRLVIDTEVVGKQNKQTIYFRAGFDYNSGASIQPSANRNGYGDNGEAVYYEVSGMTRGGKYIVHSYLKKSVSEVQEFVFILDISGDQLIKLGGFTCNTRYNNSDNRFPLIIEGDEIKNGNVLYKIPASAL